MKSGDKQAADQFGALARFELLYMRRLLMVRKGVAERRADLIAAERWAREINGQILKDLYERVIPVFGRIVVDGVKGGQIYEQKRNAGFWQSLVDKWLLQNGLTQAANITQTIIDDAQRILIDAVEQGQGTYKIGTALRDYAKISRERAIVIARTEVHGAAMYASRETAADYQALTGLVMRKTWNATLDKRVRRSHASVDNTTIAMDEKFMVDGRAMDRPGDPAGGASNVINCRCVLTYSDNFDDLE